MNKMCENMQKYLDYANYSKLHELDMSLDKNCNIFTSYTIICSFMLYYRQYEQCLMVVMVLDEAIERTKTTLYSYPTHSVKQVQYIYSGSNMIVRAISNNSVVARVKAQGIEQYVDQER